MDPHIRVSSLPSADTSQPFQGELTVSFMWTWRTSSGVLLAPRRTQSCSLWSPISYPCSWNPAYASVLGGQAGKLKTAGISLSVGRTDVQVLSGVLHSRATVCCLLLLFAASCTYTTLLPTRSPGRAAFLCCTKKSGIVSTTTWCLSEPHWVTGENIEHLTSSDPPGIAAMLTFTLGTHLHCNTLRL